MVHKNKPKINSVGLQHTTVKEEGDETKQVQMGELKEAYFI